MGTSLLLASSILCGGGLETGRVLDQPCPFHRLQSMVEHPNFGYAFEFP
jgi:hypothetical protein